MSGEWTLDPTASSVEFSVKHFWGLITVHGHFDRFTGDGRVDSDGTISGQIRIAADSVNTKNKKRDKHLRSDDFFDAERYPTITISASALSASGGQNLHGPVTLDTAGHHQAFDTVVHVVSAAADAVTLRTETSVYSDRLRDDLESSQDGRTPCPCRRDRPLRPQLTITSGGREAPPPYGTTTPTPSPSARLLLPNGPAPRGRPPEPLRGASGVARRFLAGDRQYRVDACGESHADDLSAPLAGRRPAPPARPVPQPLRRRPKVKGL